MGGGNGALSDGRVAVPGGGTPGVVDAPWGIGVACGGASGDGPGVGPDVEAGGCNGALPHAASIPTISPLHTTPRRRFMGLILLEALGALLLLVLIVWWTMFSGRKKGELQNLSNDDLEDKKGR